MLKKKKEKKRKLHNLFSKDIVSLNYVWITGNFYVHFPQEPASVKSTAWIPSAAQTLQA